MVPRFKFQLLFPGEIIKVATTYEFINLRRRGANAFKRPTLQTIQSKRAAEQPGKDAATLDSILGRFRSPPISGENQQRGPRTEGPLEQLLAQNRTVPTFAPQKARSGPNYFGPLGTFWTKPTFARESRSHV